METDMLIQLVILVFTLGIFYAIYNYPKQAITRLRLKNRSNNQAHIHFIKGAQFLTRAKSNNKNKTLSFNLAKSAANEADKALILQPKDTAAHILKALALELMGHKVSALKSLDLALSVPLVKMLNDGERGDALLKRAELVLGLNKKRRVDWAVLDCLEAVKFCSDKAKAFCLLGKCYELKGLRDEARNAFERALEIEPDLVLARDGLARLR